MAYRNQNYMTNKKIKAEVDKNQKNYVAPEVEEEIKTGNLNITVKDNYDNPVSGVNITLTDKEDNEYTAKTGSAGGCNINDLPLGEYLALAESELYVSVTKGVTINEGNNSLEIIFEEQQGTIGIAGPILEEEEGEF